MTAWSYSHLDPPSIHNHIPPNRYKPAMVTFPISTASPASLHLSSPLTIKPTAPSAKQDILSILYEAATMDPPRAGITYPHQHDTGMKVTPKRTKRRPCKVRFNNKISGKKLAPFSAEERRGIYYNVSHLRPNAPSDIGPRSLCQFRPNLADNPQYCLLT